MTPPALLSLTCNACGAPLKVHAGIRFVTCAHCGTQLQIHQEDSALFTEALEQMQSQTSALATEVTHLRLQQELERLNRNWSDRRDALCTRHRSGQLSEPSTASAWVTGTLGCVMGLVWVLMTRSTGDSCQFGLMGLGIALFSVVSAVRMQSRARTFLLAQQEYLERRAILLQSLAEARVAAGPREQRP